MFAPFVQQLVSQDEQVRREAARTLATLAPPALEPLLLTFAGSKDPALKQFAPLALFNLSTAASLATLADLLVHGEPSSYESESAAAYLGKTHDAKWVPLLLEFADQHGPMYLRYAAESGGESAIPALLARFKSSDANVRASAIYALGDTGSQTTIPMLIGLIKLTAPSADGRPDGDAGSAVGALQELTHYYVQQTAADHWVDAAHQRWQQWWLMSGQNAPIYKPGDCVPFTQLP